MLLSRLALHNSARQPQNINYWPPSGAALGGARRSLCTTQVNYQQDGKSSKPNLREAGRFGNSKIIVAACLLVAIYMYPMIFKPMFGFGTSAEEQMEKIKSSGLDASKTRPSFMPQWTSPFGPPKGKGDEE